MHLILTHEQADFDAAASLLAACLLNPDAQPVLPRRINRNVRGYLTLYGGDLPFAEQSDIQKGDVERLTLVDTQSMITLRGVSESTQVEVVDHHPPSSAIPENWSCRIELVGATTTLLVETMQTTNVELDVLASTLLLMGIYEDTGSLTYANTSSRDVLAAAWLLDKGANLEIASRFLNHPLSEDQRELYERLIESAATHQFHGLSVMIACAAAEGMVDEISTLAHKIRDVFDPAGLFVLVALDSHVQLVARSTTDSLDVSKVAEHFGGGGHNRAAAALIRDRKIEEIYEDLMGVLPEIVEPLKTVADVMSRGPQLLQMETPIHEAGERMQRYGHEGYPVLDGSQIAGLLTRRAVDRALAHNMGKRPISEIMDSGEVYVFPIDSVQRLQQVMLESNWGQIPVLDPGSRDVIGIVTRTDLIKTLGPEHSESEPTLKVQLEQALPESHLSLLKLVAEEAEKNEVALYVVGGFVRDLLLGEESIDFDLVVEGDAIALADSLAQEYGGRVSSHRRFGTAKWVIDPTDERFLHKLGLETNKASDLPANLDLVSARAEFYTHPSALPSVTQGSIKLDLHRRDFSINTLALRLDGPYYGQLLDYWGGGRDLKEGRIRVLHSLSFIDDPTRMLRAVRLEQRLGFHIDPRTLELLLHATPLLSKVSGERIQSELNLILFESRLVEIMGRLRDLGLLESIHPALKWDDWLSIRFQEAVDFEPPTDWNLSAPHDRQTWIYALWMYRSSEKEAWDVSIRLNFNLSIRQVIMEANSVSCVLDRWPDQAKPSELVACLEEQQDGTLVTVWLAEHGNQNARDALERYFREWRDVQPITDGDTLRDVGLAPGPAYSTILKRLRAAWLDDEIHNSEQEQELLAVLLKDQIFIA